MHACPILLAFTRQRVGLLPALCGTVTCADPSHDNGAVLRMCLLRLQMERDDWTRFELGCTRAVTNASSGSDRDGDLTPGTHAYPLDLARAVYSRWQELYGDTWDQVATAPFEV